jgi:tetratricopeptide (TPR) repeat protein
MKSIIVLLTLAIFNTHPDKIQNAIKYHHLKADQYFHKGNYPEMLYHLQQKVKYDPKDVNTWSDLAYYYWSLSVDNKLKNDEFKAKAFSLLKEGLKNNPNSTFMNDELGRFFIYKSNDFKSAIPYFEAAIKNKDCNNITFHLLATCYEKNNRINDAIKVLNECLKRFPDDAKAKSELNSFKD